MPGAKLEEYRDNGARLGWLLDPQTQRVSVYRPSEEVKVLTNPEALYGETVLPGFVLELRQVWAA